MIRYHKHKEIDKNKWDERINNSINGLIYAQSWYLDITSPNWEALIEDDYESIMPLPCKKKYFIPYLIQPRHTQQLGIFSNQPVSQEKVNAFLRRIPRKFIWQNFNLNSHNPASYFTGTKDRNNYELDLDTDYNTIRKGYNENTLRNLKKASQFCLTTKIINDPDTFIDLYKIHTRLNHSDIFLKQLTNIIKYGILHNCCEIVVAETSENNIIAGALYLKGQSRIIYLTSFALQEGQQKSAMFLIMDSMLRRYSNCSCTFDFEGSMIPGIARFFAGFGAKKTTYQNYTINIINNLFERRFLSKKPCF